LRTDLLEKKPYGDLREGSKIGKNGEFGCHGPALRRNAEEDT